MNKNKLHKASCRTILLGVLLFSTYANLASAAITPTDLTYYRFDANGAIIGNTANTTKKELSNLTISGTGTQRGINAEGVTAVGELAKTTNVYLADNAVIDIQSSTGTVVAIQTNAKTTLNLISGGALSLNAAGESTAIGINTDANGHDTYLNADTLSSLSITVNSKNMSYGVRHGGVGPGLIKLGNNVALDIVADARIKPGISAFAYGFQNLSTAAITAGDNVDLKMKAIGGTSGASIEALTVGNALVSGGHASIQLGNDAKLDLRADASASTASSIVMWNAGAFNNSGTIQVGDRAQIDSVSTATGTAAGEFYGAINAYNGTGDRKIIFGNDTRMDLQATSVDGKVTGYIANNQGNSGAGGGQRIIEFGNNTTINTSTVSSNNNASNYGIAHIAVQGARTTFGENTQITSFSKASGTSNNYFIYSASPSINNIIEFGNNTKVSLVGEGGKTTVLGAYLGAANQLVVFNGNTELNATAAHTSGQQSLAYLVYSTAAAAGSNLYINVDRNNGNASQGGTVKLTGDIVLPAGNVHISLPDGTSYLRGTVIQTDAGKVHLDLDNGAVWQLANNSYTAADTSITTRDDNSIEVYNLRIGNNTTIDLTADNTTRSTDWRTLNSNGAVDGYGLNITGKGNTFVLNSDIANNVADKIVIDSSAAGENYIKIGYDPTIAATGKDDINSKTLVVEAVAGTPSASLLGTFKGVASDIGVYSWTPKIAKDGDNWYITATAKKPSTTVKAATTMTSALMSTFRLVNNDLSKRMGELRFNPDSAGVWARVYTGESDVKGGGNARYTVIQGGIDKVTKTKNGKIFTGVAVENIQASNSFDNGKGSTRLTDIGVYQSWLGNKGHYYDVVGKVFNIANSMNLTDTNGTAVDGDYKSWAYGLSMEYGYRKELPKGYFITPQIEFTLRHLNGVNFTTSNGLTIDRGGMNTLKGRMGVTFGRKFNNNSQIYLTGSILREFMGNAKVNAADLLGNSISQSISGKETWYNLALGMNFKYGQKADLYFELERDFSSSSNKKWQLQAGARWSW